VTLPTAAISKRQPSTRPSSSPWSAHVAQCALEIEALGRGVHRTFADVRVADFDRTDQADFAVGATQDRLDQVGRARLAVGSSDAEQLKLGAWRAEEARRDRGHGAPAVGDDDRQAAVRIEIVGQLLDDDCRRTVRQRLFEVIVPIHHRAGEREEQVAGGDFARIVLEPANHRIGVGLARVPGGGRGGQGG